MSLHRTRNVVVHLYYSFQLCPLAVACHSDKVESVNYRTFCRRIFLAFLSAPCRKAAQDNASLLLVSIFCQFVLPLISDALCF